MLSEDDFWALVIRLGLAGWVEVVRGHEPHCQEIKDTQIKSEFIFATLADTARPVSLL